MNGKGCSPKVRTIERVTGIIKNIVVTLSTNIEATAVKVHNNTISIQTLPLLIFPNFIPT